MSDSFIENSYSCGGLASREIGVNFVDFVVYGQPASAKNQRRIVSFKGSPRLIKSEKALSYSKSFLVQCPQLETLIVDDVALLVDVYYASRRPDLACIDLIQDLLQGLVIKNDRQVKVSQSIWNLDPKTPRARIRLRTLDLEGSLDLSSFKQSEIWDRHPFQVKS